MARAAPMREVLGRPVDGPGSEERIKGVIAILAAGLERLMAQRITSSNKPTAELDFGDELAVTTHCQQNADREEC